MMRQNLIIWGSTPSQTGLKTCKKYQRTIPKRKTGIWDTNYNIKLMNSLNKQQNDPQNEVISKYLLNSPMLKPLLVLKQP